MIVPAYTFEATAGPVLQLGGVPVFVDVLSDTYCIDPAAVEMALSPRTRFIIPVHLALNMADMDANCGRASETDHYGKRIIGFNYRMTKFQAAILMAQLERLSE